MSRSLQPYMLAKSHRETAFCRPIGILVRSSMCAISLPLPCGLVFERLRRKDFLHLFRVNQIPVSRNHIGEPPLFDARPQSVVGQREARRCRCRTNADEMRQENPTFQFCPACSASQAFSASTGTIRFRSPSQIAGKPGVWAKRIAVGRLTFSASISPEILRIQRISLVILTSFRCPCFRLEVPFLIIDSAS